MKVSTILSSTALFLAFVASTVSAAPQSLGITNCKNPGVVAYTFDDGPGIYNDELLAKLASYNVTATFFVLGQMVEEHPDALKNILARGHQIASHTYDHPNLDTLSTSQILKQMTTTQDLIFQHAGVRPRFMRAPMGNCASTCQKAVSSLDMLVTYWSADTNDWKYTTDAQTDLQGALQNAMTEVNEKIVNNSNPATDSFILLEHEIHQYSVEHLVDLVVNAVLKKGYKFVSVAECYGESAYL
ncbi:chitin deacetylase [Mortierella sp. AD011]|nr:chitin deacetylase [Mortierella sp. AD010]KAF9397457.1 chitin deacetylase [Mortierella sp. AD011]